MKRILNIKILVIFTALLSMAFTSCKDDMLLGPDRLFRPILTATKGMTWIQVTWDRYSDDKMYHLEISTDSFKTVLRINTTDSTQFTYTNLDFDTDYQIRIYSTGDKVLSNNDTIRSRYFTTEVTTDDFPTYLISPTSADAVDNSIRVKWSKSNLVYTRINVMLNKDSVYKSVALTAADNEAGVKIISGLQPGTSYIVKIFTGDTEGDYKGKKTFKTAASQVLNGVVVDLRNYPDEQALNILTQAYIDSIATAHPALGDSVVNIVLGGGTKYILPTINIPFSANIVTGLSFSGKAIMAVNGSFGVKPATTVASLKVDKIFFSEGTTTGKTKLDGNFGGTYLFNFNQADGNLKKLSIDNCDIKYKRGAVRLQTTMSLDSLVIDNCVFDSIGGYGIVNNANDGSYIGDIVMTNSTVAHAEKLFVCGKAKGINSLNISRLTTCYAPGYLTAGPVTTNYFFDYNTNTIPGGITVQNSLFGACAGASTYGIRTGANTATAFLNCYRTSDLVWTTDLVSGAAKYPIEALSDFGKSSIDIFENPKASNFKLNSNTASGLIKTIGDPRWW
ncbi:MAG TPA: DUF5123 domain-containing protein [Paludibacter sp.]